MIIQGQSMKTFATIINGANAKAHPMSAKNKESLSNAKLSQ
jgi:hypothetical protein